MQRFLALIFRWFERLKVQTHQTMAEREGFEPSVHFRVHTLSRRAPSATQTSLHRTTHIAMRVAKHTKYMQQQPTSGENGAPDWIRTSDLRIRSPLLYPTEPQALVRIKMVEGN